MWALKAIRAKPKIVAEVGEPKQVITFLLTKSCEIFYLFLIASTLLQNPLINLYFFVLFLNEQRALTKKEYNVHTGILPCSFLASPLGDGVLTHLKKSGAEQQLLKDILTLTSQEMGELVMSQ